MKKIEIGLIAGSLAGFLLKIFDVPLSSLIVSLFLLSLSCLYFYLGFALLNDISLSQIFMAKAYKDLDKARIITAILTGVSLSILTIGYMFHILKYPLAKEILTIGIVYTSILLVYSIIKIHKTKIGFYKNITLRCLIFIVIAIILIILSRTAFEG